MEARTATKRQREVIEAMERMEAEGKPVTMESLVAEMGLHPRTASYHLSMARKSGLLRLDIARKPVPTGRRWAGLIQARESLHRAGEPATLAALGGAMGITRQGVAKQLHRMREAGVIDWHADHSQRGHRAGPRPRDGETGRARACIAALEGLESRGLAITTDAVAGCLGCTRRTAADYLSGLRVAGLMRWTVRPNPKRKPAPKPAPTLDELTDTDRKALAIGARMFAEDGEVSPAEVSRLVGRSWYPERARRLRDLGFWTWPAPEQMRDADPAAIVAILEEGRKGLVDARMERDDTPPGVVAMPVREVSRVESNADAVRKLVREWKRITGRVKVAPKVRDRSNDGPRTPRQARVYRFTTSHVHASRYEG